MNAVSAFDSFAKVLQLRRESALWQTQTVASARVGDIPILDLNEWLNTGG